MLERDDLEAAIESGLVKDTAPLTERLAAVRRALGENGISTDPLIDQWEKDLAEGRVPDLDAEMSR